jgi:hypothetical protein
MRTWLEKPEHLSANPEMGRELRLRLSGFKILCKFNLFNRHLFIAPMADANSFQFCVTVRTQSPVTDYQSLSTRCKKLLYKLLAASAAPY